MNLLMSDFTAVHRSLMADIVAKVGDPLGGFWPEMGCLLLTHQRHLAVANSGIASYRRCTERMITEDLASWLHSPMLSFAVRGI